VWGRDDSLSPNHILKVSKINENSKHLSKFILPFSDTLWGNPSFYSVLKKVVSQQKNCSRYVKGLGVGHPSCELDLLQETSPCHPKGSWGVAPPHNYSALKSAPVPHPPVGVIVGYSDFTSDYFLIGGSPPPTSRLRRVPILHPQGLR
jgi:hypothetical protein